VSDARIKMKLKIDEEKRDVVLTERESGFGGLEVA
jgi:hypothetical protein